MNFLSYIKKLFQGHRVRQNLLLFTLMLLFGFILMNHINSVQSENKNSNLEALYKQREQDLLNDEQTYQNLLAENKLLTQKKDQISDEIIRSIGGDSLLAELEKTRILAGFTEVSGPGVILTLDDKPDLDIEFYETESIVHDTDIRYALNLLINGGAAAFSINGNRYTNASNIDCIGPTIRCNLERLTPPYVIFALGDPAKLSEVIRNDQTFNNRQAIFGLVVKIQPSDEVVIPAFIDADKISQYINLLEGIAP